MERTTKIKYGCISTAATDQSNSPAAVASGEQGPPIEPSARARQGRGLQERLLKSFKSAPEASNRFNNRFEKPSKVLMRRGAKTVAALCVALFLGWKPLMTLFEGRSVEAFVNARVITLRSPIDGEVSDVTLWSTTGGLYRSGESLLTVSNPRVDKTRRVDLIRAINEIEVDWTAAKNRLARLKALHSRLVAQYERFRDGRLHQLAERQAEIRVNLLAAKANEKAADAQLKRDLVLSDKGLATRRVMDLSIRDDNVATQTVKALQHQSAAMDVELRALKDNNFIGDSFNDRPQSAQRADEIALAIEDTTAAVEQFESRFKQLHNSLALEDERLGALTSANLTVPITAAVWEILTSEGEHVKRGQPLVRLLDCGPGIISAAVEEDVYNKLKVGDPAYFRLRGASEEKKGRIVRLSGLASAPANLAISPSSLLKAPYRASVEIPGLSKSAHCDVGRTGKVRFPTTSYNDDDLSNVVAARD